MFIRVNEPYLSLDYRPLSKSPRPAPESQKSQGRVLIVDDDGGIRRSLSAILQEEFRVRTASSCDTARALLGREPFDVVMSDFEMPVQDGLSFLDYVQRQYPATVGLLLTGRAEHAKVNKAQKEWSRYRVLLKPVEPQSLISTIRTSFHVSRLRQSTGRLSNLINK